MPLSCSMFFLCPSILNGFLRGDGAHPYEVTLGQTSMVDGHFSAHPFRGVRLPYHQPPARFREQGRPPFREAAAW